MGSVSTRRNGDEIFSSSAIRGHIRQVSGKLSSAPALSVVSQQKGGPWIAQQIKWLRGYILLECGAGSGEQLEK